MQRVAVIGPGGAGKSTFSEKLGRRTGLPVVHLDQYFWQPGWVETPRDAWRAWQEETFSSERWIADGNYSRTFDVRLARADTVILLSPPRRTCLLGVLCRYLRNRGEAVQAAGCPERVDPAFLRWIWRYPKDSRPRLDAAIRRHRDHLEIIELRSRSAMRTFLADLNALGPIASGDEPPRQPASRLDVAPPIVAG